MGGPQGAPAPLSRSPHVVLLLLLLLLLLERRLLHIHLLWLLTVRDPRLLEPLLLLQMLLL